MRLIIALTFLMLSTVSYGQDQRITTIDFVQILDDQRDEAVYYYQNNWKVLRETAIKKEFIHSYQLLETPFTEEGPFHLMLITTYRDQDQYDLREDHFGELIKARGGLSLMNDKEPAEFRKVLFNKDMVEHLH